MEGWAINPATGRREWLDSSGQWHVNRPMEEPTPRIPRTDFERYIGVPSAQYFEGLSLVPQNVGVGIENFTRGVENFFTRPSAGPRQQTEPVQAPEAPPLPEALQLNPAAFGVSAEGPTVTPFQPTPFPDPPPRTPNPALAGRTQYMQDREARISQMFERYLEEAGRNDLSQRPWWDRLGRIAGEIAAQPRLAYAGRATAGYFDEETRRRMAIQDQMMRLGLAREDLSGDVAEARFNEETGQWEATTGTERDEYNTTLANIGARNTADQRNYERQDAADQAAWGSNQAMARELFAQGSEQLNQALVSAAAGGNIEAYGSLFGRLPERMQQTQMERASQQGLAAIIEEHGGRYHRKMEELAGRRLPRAPRSLRNNPAALARWYANNGVPLSHPEIRQAFPGFAPPE